MRLPRHLASGSRLESTICLFDDFHQQINNTPPEKRSPATLVDKLLEIFFISKEDGYQFRGPRSRTRLQRRAIVLSVTTAQGCFVLGADTAASSSSSLLSSRSSSSSSSSTCNAATGVVQNFQALLDANDFDRASDLVADEAEITTPFGRKTKPQFLQMLQGKNKPVWEETHDGAHERQSVSLGTTRKLGFLKIRLRRLVEINDDHKICKVAVTKR